MPIFGNLQYFQANKQLGMRGVTEDCVCLQQFPRVITEPCFFTGAPANRFPYLPDMGPNSEYERNGKWHHYETTDSLFAAVFLDEASHKGYNVIQIVHFAGESEPRVLQDERQRLLSEGHLTAEELAHLDEVLCHQFGHDHCFVPAA